MPHPSHFAAERPPRGRLGGHARVAVHVLAWSGVVLLPLVVDSLTQHAPPPGFHYWFVLLPVTMLATFYYLNSLVLIPRLLARRRIVQYFAAVLLTAAGTSGALALVRLTLLPQLPQPGAGHLSPAAALLLSYGVVWALSSWGRITSEWFEAERRRRELENGHLSAELALLKSQVSPHFLFNTLNNVYSLAELKSDDAPAAILQLSQLLRYLLYEAAAPQVPLTRELAHLRTYVDLERLRLDPELVPIAFAVEGDPQGLLIEPMLLMPFVENAFKHGVGAPGRAPICLRLRVDEQGLTFMVRNRVAPVGSASPGPGGMGLANVRQRLALLYPGRHALALERPGADFLATLTLTFAHDPAPLPARR